MAEAPELTPRKLAPAASARVGLPSNAAEDEEVTA